MRARTWPSFLLLLGLFPALIACTARADDPSSPMPAADSDAASSDEQSGQSAIDANSARDWKSFEKPSQSELREGLSDLEYYVTQEEGTERPFQNRYWDQKKPGIYVDIVSGEPLFSSLEKFRSGTGWPSFYAPLEKEYIVEKKDRSFGMVRVEVRSKNGDSHLGHLFEDGPEPTGLRYCINSASLRFVPVEELEAQGYGDYANLFEGTPGNP